MGLLDSLSEAFREPALYVITVDGEEIDDLYPMLSEVSVECSRTCWCEGTLRFESRRDERGTWLVQDEESLVPWKPIIIEAAFGAHTEEVMRGYIQQVDASYPDDAGAATITVKCRDASILLDREHVRTTWGTEEEPIADSDILRQIVVDRHDLLLHAENGIGQDGLVQQHQDSTDIAFLKRRADANGYEVYFEGDTLYFGPMRLKEEAQPAIKVYAGPCTNCAEFSVTADGHKPDMIALEVADPEEPEVLEHIVTPDLDLLGSSGADSTSRELGDFVWRLSREGTSSEEQMLAVAQRKANEFSMKVHATGSLDGTAYGHVLQVGHPVAVDGIGSTLGGVYYVDTLNHQFTIDGYVEKFTLLRNAYGDNL
jgi:phage protein D